MKKEDNPIEPHPAAKILEARMHELNLTAADLSKVTPATQPTLSKLFKKGSKQMPFDALFGILQYLYDAKSIDEIFGRISQKAPVANNPQEQARKSSAEQSLIRLSILVGIDVDADTTWQESFADWMGIKLEIVYNWIMEDDIPQDTIATIEARGFSADQWLSKKFGPTIEDCIIKLCRLAGIDPQNDFKWGVKLGKKLNINPDIIEYAISQKTLDQELIDYIKDAGYPPELWLPKGSYRPRSQRKPKSLTSN